MIQPDSPSFGRRWATPFVNMVAGGIAGKAGLFAKLGIFLLAAKKFLVIGARADSFARCTMVHGKVNNTDELESCCKESVMEATPPATPRHTMFPLWLLPSGSDQVHG